MVEVGSGLGLCGLTAATLMPRHVIISEANDACLHAIHDAIQLNQHTPRTGEAVPPIGPLDCPGEEAP